MTAWIDAVAAKLPPELVAWARTQPDLATAWTSCARVEWLIDLGAALPLDDVSRRAQVTASVEILRADPTFLRLKPAPYRIAEAWAMKWEDGWHDVLGLMRYDDYTNGILAGLPIVLAVVLVLQYHFHAPQSLLRAIRFVALAALPGWGVVWRFARLHLTARALRRYRYERAERDVFAPARWTATRLPESMRPALVSAFHRGCARVADFPSPRLSAS